MSGSKTGWMQVCWQGGAKEVSSWRESDSFLMSAYLSKSTWQLLTLLIFDPWSLLAFVAFVVWSVNYWSERRSPMRVRLILSAGLTWIKMTSHAILGPRLCYQSWQCIILSLDKTWEIIRHYEAWHQGCGRNTVVYVRRLERHQHSKSHLIDEELVSGYNLWFICYRCSVNGVAEFIQ